MVRCDDEIKKDVMSELAWDNRVDAVDVTVEVNEGKVMLHGAVPTYSAKRSAEQDAFNVPGVVSVENNLDVRYTPKTPPPSDERIRHCIENVISWMPDIHGPGIRISVYAGWVTLEGSVDSYWKKLKAEDLAANIIGVMGISNRITIVPSEQIADKAIAEKVVAALDRNNNIDTDSVDVTVENGVTTISGVVPSWIAYSAAQEAVVHTKGVTEVRNNLTVS